METRLRVGVKVEMKLGFNESIYASTCHHPRPIPHSPAMYEQRRGSVQYRYLISSCRSLQSPSATSASREEQDTTPPRRQKGDGFDLGSVVDEPVLN